MVDQTPSEHDESAFGTESGQKAPDNPYLYRARNLVERFFNKIKHYRRVATRYNKLAANYLHIHPTCVDQAVAAH
jgi:transposase